MISADAARLSLSQHWSTAADAPDAWSGRTPSLQDRQDGIGSRLLGGLGGPKRAGNGSFVPQPDSCTAPNMPPYRITSSARASTNGSTVMPGALAVLRSMRTWNLVACSTGRSPGFAPCIGLLHRHGPMRSSSPSSGRLKSVSTVSPIPGMAAMDQSTYA